MAGRPNVVAEVFSDVLTVLGPREFPGMKESSPMILSFKKQGLKLVTRKGNSTKA